MSDPKDHRLWEVTKFSDVLWTYICLDCGEVFKFDRRYVPLDRADIEGAT